MKQITAAIWVLVLLTFALSLYFYPALPEKMASHWNMTGEVDGYLPKFWGAFLLPFISAVITFLLLTVPYIDPLKKNIDKFRSYYDGFILLLLIFLLAVHTHGLLWNMGTEISINMFMPIGLALLFVYTGILLGKAKRNWFIGIKKPWTLSSDLVWDKTHKLGSQLFKILAVLVLGGIFWPEYAVFFILIPVFTVVLVTVVYSYFEYQKGKDD